MMSVARESVKKCPKCGQKTLLPIAKENDAIIYKCTNCKLYEKSKQNK